MSKYLAEWTKLKNDFAALVVGEIKKGGSSFPTANRQQLVTVLKIETGLTPALKEVDVAFASKERKPAMQALTKVHLGLEKIAIPIQQAALAAADAGGKAVDQAAQDALLEIAQAGMDFKRAILTFEPRIAAELEALQVQKSATGAKVDILSLEGDMLGALNRFKIDVKVYSSIEKVHKLVPATGTLVTKMAEYSKAAARTDVQGAIVALDAFFEAVEKFDTFRKKAGQASGKADNGYWKAADVFCGALRLIKTGRGEVSMKNLKSLGTGGTA